MESKSKDLLKNTVVYSIGNFGSKILNFGLLPIYSYTLSTNDFGYYDLVVTTITMLIPFITLQISDAVFRWLIGSESQQSNTISTISTAFVLIAINTFFFSLLSIVASCFFEIKHILLITILLVVSSFYPFIQQSVRGLRKTKLFAISGLIFSGIFLSLNLVLLIIFNMSVSALFISSIAANIFAGFFLVYKSQLWKYISISKFEIKMLKELVHYSTPLIPNTISWWLIMSANKYFIVYFLGQDSLGIYSFSNRFPGLLVMLNNIFMMAWQESAILNIKDKNNQVFFSKVFKVLVQLQLSTTAILIIGSELLIDIAVSENFYESWRYLPFLYFGAAFSSLSGFFGSIYLGVKDTKSTFVTSIVGGVVNIILSLILIKPFGLYGVAFANLFSFFVLFVYRVFDTKKYIKISFDKVLMSKLFSLILISFFVVYKLQGMKVILSLIVMILISLYFNKQIILKLTDKIKEKIYGILKF